MSRPSPLLQVEVEPLAAGELVDLVPRFAPHFVQKVLLPLQVLVQGGLPREWRCRDRNTGDLLTCGGDGMGPTHLLYSGEKPHVHSHARARAGRTMCTRAQVCACGPPHQVRLLLLQQLRLEAAHPCLLLDHHLRGCKRQGGRVSDLPATCLSSHSRQQRALTATLGLWPTTASQTACQLDLMATSGACQSPSHQLARWRLLTLLTQADPPPCNCWAPSRMFECLLHHYAGPPTAAGFPHLL